MKTVNAYYLHHALGPLNAMTDSEYEAAVADWDESAPQGIRSSSLATSSRATTAGMSSRRGMCSTRYSTAWRPAGSISPPFWRTSGTPMPCPDDPREVFEALWQVLAPGRSYRADDIATWQERNIREEAVIRERRENPRSGGTP